MIEAIVPWLAVVAVAAGLVLACRAGRIGFVVGLLFAAASFSRITAPLGPYSVRLEQPALVILIGLVLVRERDAIRRAVTDQPWLIAAGALYLGANLVSSTLFAARPFDSLRIAGWLGLSMAGGLAVAAVVARAPGAARALPGWIVGAASIQVGVGLVAVLSQGILNTMWGVQFTDVILGKTFALSWEANILAINLAMALAFLLVPGSGLRLAARARLLTTAWLGFGLGLAYSRGGAVGLAGAAVLAGALVAWTARADPLPALRRYVAPMLRLGLVAFVAAFVTTGGLDALASRGVGWTPSTVVIGQPTAAAPSPAVTSPGPGATPPSPSAAVSPNPTAAVSPTPMTQASHELIARYVGTSDTLAVRLQNIAIGLAELPRSPVVGLGTDSFQQRHIEPSCECPAHISNLMVGALYDSGIVGFIGLVVLLAGVLYLAWSRGEWAYLVALLAMVIGYQATDAFRFASNWVVMGVVLGIAASRPNLANDRRLSSLAGSSVPTAAPRER